MSGAVYTRPWVANLILDLAGYVAEKDLAGGTLVEPGCGDGKFLGQAVERLLDSAVRYGRASSDLGRAIRAYDINPSATIAARLHVRAILEGRGVESQVAHDLASEWISSADFLLMKDYPIARWVVGNPPYVRIEDVEQHTYGTYRERWSDMTGRADLYIGFYQASLAMLEPEGVLGFICADRWMHNQYGSALRKRVIADYSLDVLLEMHKVDLFENRVSAYPAITIVRSGTPSKTAMGTATASFGAHDVAGLLAWMDGDNTSSEAISIGWLDEPLPAEESWPFGPPERIAELRRLEKSLPTLDEVGVKIGVGLATGADSVYIQSGAPDVEPSLLKKVIGPLDIQKGAIAWQGRWLVCPWLNRDLVELADFPRFQRFVELHKERLTDRSVARTHKSQWWRTIDRPSAGEYAEPKLVVADLENRIEPVLDTEGYWPLHSAYFLTSSSWDLSVLGGYLISETASQFIEAYSVRMGSGHFRISAQYLKKIRIPGFDRLSDADRQQLARAFETRDRVLATETVRQLLGRILGS